MGALGVGIGPAVEFIQNAARYKNSLTPEEQRQATIVTSNYRVCRRVLVVSVPFSRQVQRLANGPGPAKANTAPWM